MNRTLARRLLAVSLVLAATSACGDDDNQPDLNFLGRPHFSGPWVEGLVGPATVTSSEPGMYALRVEGVEQDGTARNGSFEVETPLDLMVFDGKTVTVVTQVKLTNGTPDGMRGISVVADDGTAFGLGVHHLDTVSTLLPEVHVRRGAKLGTVEPEAGESATLHAVEIEGDDGQWTSVDPATAKTVTIAGDLWHVVLGIDYVDFVGTEHRSGCWVEETMTVLEVLKGDIAAPKPVPVGNDEFPVLTNWCDG